MTRTKRTPTGRVRALTVRIEESQAWDGQRFSVVTAVVTAKLETDWAAAPMVVRATEIKNVGTLWLDRDGSDIRHAIGDNELDDFSVRVDAGLDRYDEGRPRVWSRRADFADCHGVDLAIAKRMVRVLTRVEAALARYDASDVSVGEWIARGARTIGATTLLFPEMTPHGSYDNTPWLALPPIEAQERIDAAYAAWVARVAPQHAAASS